ncbi:hypothetical protein CkaCkLH20_10478 [Colletotrichum karsti]|uniref:Heterokaryon incompatibility domain-containing protein n=1 Tax=Colletotrichum karsti TaxID=1095194 RepID=A0A9P6HZN8_9PEZI|nr:uncharacterized protein CkaCkLH20_10478 [Colletotrichum karsti]KAF9872141.1 hypothetical protein CkaCkLH20_10478 [Colletotrichum karsti]
MRSNECLHVAAAAAPSPPKPSSPQPSKSSSYTYSPLERDQIRLVVLESSSDPSDPLTCRILACHRSDAPPYEAISHYCAPTDSHDALIRVLSPILIPSAPTNLTIPHAVASTLLALRHADRPRTLWLDALSINASNTAERSAQVLITPQIFHAAWRVIIPLAGDYAEAISFISLGRFRSTPPQTLLLLQHLFAHPWFSQTWSIPQIARSRAAFVLHAAALTPFTNFSLCARTLDLAVPVTSPIRRLKQRGAIPSLTTTQFLKAVAEASSCAAPADPRDRVFAFLPLYPALMTRSQIETYRSSGFGGDDDRGGGMRGKARGLGGGGGGGGGAVSAVEVIEDEKTRARMTDYGSDVRTVYTQFATLLLSDAGLDFLSTVQGRVKSDRLPSWVPDWRVNSGRTILAHLPLTEFAAGGHWGDQSFRIVPTEDGGKLELSAVCLGEIAVLGNACDIRCEGWEEVVFRQWRDLAEDARRGRGLKECPSKILEAFVQTVMTDSDEEHVDARKMLCRRVSVLDEKRQIDSKALFDGLDDEAITKLRISCHGRRLFVTSKGIMGLVASESKERDLIAVLPGARMPYSFRHRYDLASADVELVGECFLQGMMKGEALSRGVSFVKREIRIC